LQFKHKQTFHWEPYRWCNC